MHGHQLTGLHCLEWSYSEEIYGSSQQIVAKLSATLSRDVKKDRVNLKENFPLGELFVDIWNQNDQVMNHRR